MFEKEWDYVIMSFHDDMIFKNYINKREGFSVTLSPSRKFGDTSVIGIEDTTYEGGKKSGWMKIFIQESIYRKKDFMKILNGL